MPFKEQQNLRPNDSFLHAAFGMQNAEANPSLAVEALAKAAELVPQDFDVEVDILDLDRMELLLTAARVAEFGARQSNDRGVELASLSVNYYRKARDCVDKKDARWPRDIKVVYARACALAGRGQEANGIMDQLLKGSPDDPWLLYDYACVKSMMHESASCFDYLSRSFTIQPRWQPYALKDTCLAFVNEHDRQRVELICANPLIGRWTGENNLILDFHNDRSMSQTSGREFKQYTYELLDNKTIRFTSIQANKIFSYEVNRNRLKLVGGGHIYELTRFAPRLFGIWKYGNGHSFEFRDDGTWVRIDNVATTGTFLIISPKDGKGHEVRCLRDNILKPEQEKRYEVQVDLGTLKLRPWLDSTWFELKR